MVHGRWALVASALLMVGCEGPAGPQGETGPTATGDASLQGPPGPQGPAGPSGLAATSADGGFGGIAIQSSCLSPCHGFNGVVSQFQASVHYTEYVANVASATPEAAWTTPGAACGNCHAIDAIEQRVGGNVLTSGNGVVAHLASGALEYREPVTHALASANYAGNATVAEVYCTTCHAVTDANDPHRTGVPWTPGSFPLRVAGDAGPVFVDKSPDTTDVVGTSARDFGPGDTCMWCHRSRVDVTNYIPATGTAITSVHWGPHEGPQADLFTGVGGYQYKGQSYGQSTHEQKLSCIDCHMVTVPGNAGVPDHSFNATLTACASCHAGATTFDVNGFQSQIQASLTQIETWLNGQGVLTRAAASPYAILTSAQLGDGNWALDQPVPGAMIAGALMTQDQAGALYDYILVARGGASGVHNPKYIAQLLYDAYDALAHLPLAAFPQRPQ